MKKIILFLGFVLMTVSLNQIKAQTPSYEEFQVEEINDKQSHYMSKALGLTVEQTAQIKTINYNRLMENAKPDNNQTQELIDKKYFSDIKIILNDQQKKSWLTVVDNLSKIK